MTSTPDRLRPVPATLSTEGHVLAAVEAFVQTQPAGMRDVLPAVSATGLLAISIPAAFGGRISRTLSSPKPSAGCRAGIPVWPTGLRSTS